MKRIITVLVIVALLPLGFIVYELNSLTENEKIVREIYQNQLDAILFSINQYSDDVIGTWATRVNIAVMDKANVSDSVDGVSSVLQQFGAIQHVFLTNASSHSVVFGRDGNERKNRIIQQRLDSLATSKMDRIAKLMQYKQAGFRKMELLDSLSADTSIPIFFVMDEGTPLYHVGAIVIDLPQFFENTIGPKMQAIAQERFVLAAHRADTDSLIYATASGAGEIGSDESLKKPFSLLPGYYLTISITGTTINELVQNRTMTSLAILCLLVIILGLGIWFLYHNIKREMDLARAKSEFVSNVSHEIRTPLSLISMYAETLEMNRVTEEKKHVYHQIIAGETARLSGIVNRILNFSQAQANKKTYDWKPVQLNQLVDQVLASYSFHLKDKGFICEVIKDANLQMITGDHESITETIINLIDNSMKYSHETKRITIRTGVAGKFNYVEVSDEGIGILKKYHSEIFDQFYRAPTGDVHTTKGSGLGLTLVKKAMDAHRGKVSVESAPGKGSTFRLYFPLKVDQKS
jgi:two-component system, OmpR family, phosphate regulon sensor histidine kinase PhoR